MDDIEELLAALPILAGTMLAGFLLWRLIVGNSLTRIGWWPLVVGYAYFVGILFASSIIFGFVYLGLPVFVTSVPFAMLAISLVAVPVAALMVRTDRLNYWIAAAVVVVASCGTGVFLAIAYNSGWEIPYILPPEAPLALMMLFVFALAVPSTVAFFLGLIRTIRRQQRQSTFASERQGKPPNLVG